LACRRIPLDRSGGLPIDPGRIIIFRIAKVCNLFAIFLCNNWVYKATRILYIFIFNAIASVHAMQLKKKLHAIREQGVKGDTNGQG
jgi:hypothetical protein